MFRKIISWIVLAGIGLLIAWPWWEYYLQTHTHDILVTHVDAPEVCYEHGKGRWDRRRSRSSAPEIYRFLYCGAVVTDRGQYEIPDSRGIIGIPESRHDVWSQLKPGCRYTVRIVGPGDPFEIGDRGRLPIQQRISNIIEAHSCEAGETE